MGFGGSLRLFCCGIFGDGAAGQSGRRPVVPRWGGGSSGLRHAAPPGRFFRSGRLAGTAVMFIIYKVGKSHFCVQRQTFPIFRFLPPCFGESRNTPALSNNIDEKWSKKIPFPLFYLHFLSDNSSVFWILRSVSTKSLPLYFLNPLGPNGLRVFLQLDN